MTATPPRLLTAALRSSLLLSLALAAAACNVSASGQIPCYDDSNCPNASRSAVRAGSASRAPSTAAA